MTKLRPINRRTFLRGVGGAALALPYLDAMAVASTTNLVPIRMVCAGLNFGFVPQLFFPEDTGRNYKLSARLKPLENLRDDFTVFSGLDHGTEGQGGHGGVHAYLSGVLSRNSKGMPEANISIDQKAAQHVGPQTRYSSLQIASGHDPNNMISWSAAGVSLPPVTNVETLYNLLFQKVDPSLRKSTQASYAARTSILDLVKTDADYLKRKVGQRNREKLERYFTSVREVEKRLTQASQWLDKPKPVVDYELPASADDFDFVDRVPLYYDLIALALQTDSTRVVSLALADIGTTTAGLTSAADIINSRTTARCLSTSPSYRLSNSSIPLNSLGSLSNCRTCRNRAAKRCWTTAWFYSARGWATPVRIRTRTYR